jgi:hypothetical protein
MAEITSSMVGRLLVIEGSSPTLKLRVQILQEVGHSPVLHPLMDSLSISWSLHLKRSIVI